MAFSITTYNGMPNSPETKEYLCTSLDDLAKLPRYGIRGTQNVDNETVDDDPCAIGSEALICTGTSTEVYKLTPDNEWTKM